MMYTVSLLLTALLCAFTYTDSYVLREDLGAPFYNAGPDVALDKRNSWWSKRSYDENGNMPRDSSDRLEQFPLTDRARLAKRNSFWTKKSVELSSRHSGCVGRCAAISDHCDRDYATLQRDSVLCHVAKQLCYEWCPTHQ